jgi:hypothetical protein
LLMHGQLSRFGLKMQFRTLERSLGNRAAEKFLPVEQWRYTSDGLAF